MKPFIQLSIPEPCHENWQHMTLSEKGRFCNACSKEVVDFTMMSDHEVLHYFLNHKNDRVCGRMHSDQLQRKIEPADISKRKISWYWNYAAMLLLSVFKPGNAESQKLKLIPPVSMSTPQQTANHNQIIGKVKALPEKEVTGKVTDESGYPIPFAAVRAYGSKKIVQASASGDFQMLLPHDVTKLEINSAGYNSTLVDINSSGKVNCTLHRSNQLLSGVVVVAGYIRTDDYESAPVYVHMMAIEVKDKNTQQPLNASIKIKNPFTDKIKLATTGKDGIYKLRRIKESEKYDIIISAPGYKTDSICISGRDFGKRTLTRQVLLEKESINLATENENKCIVLGGVSTVVTEPIYIIDEQVADKQKAAALDPADIKEITALDAAKAQALFGVDGKAGGIIISTKTGQNKNITLQQNSLSNKEEKPLFSKLVITPNPVIAGTEITATFHSERAGEALLQIINSSGELLKTIKTTLTTGTNTVHLSVDKNWPGGIYYLGISTSTNKIISAGFIVE